MWVRHFFLGLMGLTSGFAVAGGTFALIVAISVVPRIIGMSRTAKEVLRYENMIIAGGILGNLITVYHHDGYGYFNSVWASDAGFIWAVQRHSGRMPCDGAGGNYECISDCVPQAEIKNWYAVGDYLFGSRKSARRPVVFFPADRTVTHDIDGRRQGVYNVFP